MTPIFGGIYDKYGKGATIMVIGSVLLILVHLLFAMPLLNYWWFVLFACHEAGASHLPRKTYFAVG